MTGLHAAGARCLVDDLDALVLHLHYPTRHRRRSARHARLVEVEVSLDQP
jgi:hypothetical protein